MKPLPWSISTLDKFVSCPRQYAEIKVYRKVKETEGEAAKWGNRVHDAAESFLKREKDLDPELEFYRPYLQALQELPGEPHVEMKMALDLNLNVVDFGAGNAWVRGKCDYLTINGAVARGVDHKTGKRKHSRQMILMALLIFYHFPYVQEVRTAFFWLKTNEKDIGRYRRGDIPSMWNQFVVDLQQYKQAFQTETWQPRQSGLCRGWCPVTTCEFWKPKQEKRR
jgi:hypothetical protein